MLTVFWGCLIFGVLFAFVSVVLGDLLSSAVDGMLDFLSIDILQPMVVAGAVTAFGGAGIMLTKYTGFGSMLILLLAVLIALGIALIVYFAYVRPMRNAENSTAFSMRRLTGRIGEVIVPIPAQGYGEVLMSTGAGHTNQIAASFEKIAIQAGTKVVIVEVKDDTLFVSRFEQ